MTHKQDNMDLLALTTDIVAAHVSNNQLDTQGISDLIKDVHKTLSQIHQKTIEASETLEPAVPIHKSVMPDYIVCLEDGKKLKMLKRYLKTAFDMTPEEYRDKWGLPLDYPMVAPNYAKQRSALAKEIGLGTAKNRGDE